MGHEMVWEDKNLVVEEEVESSDEEEESDVPEDDFDINTVESGGNIEDADEEEEDAEEEDESDSEEDGDEGGIKAPIVIGEGAEDESDNSEEEESIENNESDAESKDNDDETDDEEEEEEEEGNVGWADAMAKGLAMGKNSEKAVSVLSKAKKDNVKKKTVKTGDNVGSDGEEVEEEVEKKYEPLALRKARKREVDSIGRRMPDVLERNAEKALSKIATRGVVQLFNAVREQQKDLKTKLKDAGGSFRRQEKVFKTIDKNSFVEILTGKPISKPLDEPATKKPKTEVKNENEENQSTWNILRDDFMLGAKMRDWDKESDGE